MSSDIQLNGAGYISHILKPQIAFIKVDVAEEAGLIFRVIGDWNFWGIILNKYG